MAHTQSQEKFLLSGIGLSVYQRKISSILRHQDVVMNVPNTTNVSKTRHLSGKEINNGKELGISRDSNEFSKGTNMSNK